MKVNLKKAAGESILPFIMFHDFLTQENVKENAATCNNSPLRAIDNILSASFILLESFIDKFVNNMAIGYRFEVAKIIRASTLWDESDCNHIPGIKKDTGIKEVLDCVHYIFPYDIPRYFKEATILAIKTRGFIFRDTLHLSLYLIRREMQIEDVSMLVV